MSKRVLIVSQHFWPENFRINDIAAGFVENGIEVDVLCGLPNYPQGEYFDGYSYSKPRRQEYNGVQIYRCGEIRRKNNTSLRIFLNYVSFPFYALFSLPRIKKNKYDAVFCYETSPVLMIYPAIRAAKKNKVPLTAYVLDLWPENLYSVLPVKSKFLRKIAQNVSDWHYKRCNKLIAVSDGMAQKLSNIDTLKNCKKPSITVIPQHCEDFYTEEIIDEELVEKYSDKFNIIFTGNLSPAQDLENLIAAMKIVKTKKNKTIRCLIVGDGMSRQHLQDLVKQCGLEDEIEFCGSVPATDIPKWTHIASALYIGLKESGDLGLTVPAKMQSYCAAGRPILASLAQQAAIEAEKCGAAFVSAPSCPEALAQNIVKLYEATEEERKRLGNSGQAYYEQNYKRSLLLKKLEDFIFM